ncbi:MAG: molybdopterin molybdotransferase MoeA [Rhodanobacteraceae bacterium]|nr:molybdopterin molybdotransferase MoeA [Rhodanobacteraceae bacterium]
MISVDEALEIIRGSCMPLAVERVPLLHANGRVLAVPVDAPRALPAFDNSAMDGYALRWCEGLGAGSELPVLAEQAAGDGVANQSEGACSIMTGARIPDGLDTVVPVEDCTVTARNGEGGPRSIILSAPLRAGQHVRRAGEDVAAGQRVLEAGARLDAEALMVLRGIGIGAVDVRRRPRLALACTGRELVDADGAGLAPGQIANTNGPYLEHLFIEAGADLVERVTLPDEPSAFAAWLTRWLEAGVELVVTTGAVSMGRYDFVPEVLRAAGMKIVFHKLRMRPGKPLLLAAAGGSLVFGLPGNPMACAAGARFFVNAALRAFAGRRPEQALLLPLAEPVRKKPGFRLIQKAALAIGSDAVLTVRLLPGQESFRTAPLLAAQAWAVLPEEGEILPAGTPVPVYPLRAGAALFDGRSA